jgi:hypothetical protein
MFRLCSKCSESVQIFSNVQNLFRIFSNVQNLFRIFSVMFRICSEFSVMFRICSEFSVMFSNVQTLFRISSTKTGLFRISWLCSDIISVFYLFISYSRVRIMVFNATFNNIAVISWQSVLLVEESGGTGENHRPTANHWQTLSHNVASSTPRLSWLHR